MEKVHLCPDCDQRISEIEYRVYGSCIFCYKSWQEPDWLEDEDEEENKDDH